MKKSFFKLIGYILLSIICSIGIIYGYKKYSQNDEAIMDYFISIELNDDDTITVVPYKRNGWVSFSDFSTMREGDVYTLGDGDHASVDLLFQGKTLTGKLKFTKIDSSFFFGETAETKTRLITKPYTVEEFAQKNPRDILIYILRYADENFYATCRIDCLSNLVQIAKDAGVDEEDNNLLVYNEALVMKYIDYVDENKIFMDFVQLLIQNLSIGNEQWKTLIDFVDEKIQSTEKRLQHSFEESLKHPRHNIYKASINKSQDDLNAYRKIKEMLDNQLALQKNEKEEINSQPIQ